MVKLSWAVALCVGVLSFPPSQAFGSDAVATGGSIVDGGPDAPGATPNATTDGFLPAELARLKEQLSEVRRDQLTYQIERDLLKEAYSSNLETVNLAITLGLALLAVLGFAGVRSIGAT